MSEKPKSEQKTTDRSSKTSEATITRRPGSWYEKVIPLERPGRCWWCKETQDHLIVITLIKADGSEEETSWPLCPYCKGC